MPGPSMEAEKERWKKCCHFSLSPPARSSLFGGSWWLNPTRNQEEKESGDELTGWAPQGTEQGGGRNPDGGGIQRAASTSAPWKLRLEAEQVQAEFLEALDQTPRARNCCSCHPHVLST